MTELAERTGMYKSTALRLLASLQHAGLMQRDAETGRYGLGPEIARLHAIYSASFSIGTVVTQALKSLVEKTGESAAYHVLQRQGASLVRIRLFRVNSPHSLRDHVTPGDVLPERRGAGARVLIAFGDPELQRGATAKEKALYRKIRSDGHVALVGDREPDLAGISAPVFSVDGSLAGAITLTMPAHRYDSAHIRFVLETAKNLSGHV